MHREAPPPLTATRYNALDGRLPRRSSPPLPARAVLHQAPPRRRRCDPLRPRCATQVSSRHLTTRRPRTHTARRRSPLSLFIAYYTLHAVLTRRGRASALPHPAPRGAPAIRHPDRDECSPLCHRTSRVRPFPGARGVHHRAPSRPPRRFDLAPRTARQRAPSVVHRATTPHARGLTRRRPRPYPCRTSHREAPLHLTTLRLTTRECSPPLSSPPLPACTAFPRHPHAAASAASYDAHRLAPSRLL